MSVCVCSERASCKNKDVKRNGKYMQEETETCVGLFKAVPKEPWNPSPKHRAGSSERKQHNHNEEVDVKTGV